MNKESLIFVPLTVLIALALINQAGLGQGQLGGVYIGGNPENAVYYDESGHALCYISNLTSIGETGTIYDVQGVAFWVNSTNFLGQPTNLYFMFYDNAASQALLFKDVGKSNTGGIGSISISSSLGVIALIIGLVALVIIAGIRIFSSGTSETGVSALWLSTGLMSIWGIFSLIALDLVILIELGPILYIVLTIAYCIGIILQVGK